MACLSTSGRVVCGTRRQQTHKLLYQLFGTSSSAVSGSGVGSRPGYAGNPHPGLALPKTQLQAQRLFHGLSFNIGKDYPDLLVSSLPAPGAQTRTWPRVHWQRLPLLLRMRQVFTANASA